MSAALIPHVVLIPGDGIGPEVIAAAVVAVEAAGGSIRWEHASAGVAATSKLGEPLPTETIAALHSAKLALKGPLTTQVGAGAPSLNVVLRQMFHLYANVRPARTIPGVRDLSRYEGVDIVVIRENTEGMYSGLEQSVSPDGEVARTTSQVTRKASERIARFAFDYAQKNGRKRVTAVHKANILKATSGLFLKTAREVSTRFPAIEFREAIIDATCMQLVKDPSQFDIILTTNLFGDILSDLCAGLVGGLGVTPSANIGEGGAIFEAVHGSAPDIAGRGIANPAATMLSAALLLTRVGQISAAHRLEAAVYAALADLTARTPDVGGRGTTRTFTDAVLRGCRAVH